MLTGATHARIRGALNVVVALKSDVLAPYLGITDVFCAGIVVVAKCLVDAFFIDALVLGALIIVITLIGFEDTLSGGWRALITGALVVVVTGLWKILTLTAVCVALPNLTCFFSTLYRGTGAFFAEAKVHFGARVVIIANAALMQVFAAALFAAGVYCALVTVFAIQW